MTRVCEDHIARLDAIEASGGGIADNAVTNAKLADMATATFKGRSSAGTGDPEDMSVAQVLALLGLGGSGSTTIKLSADVTNNNATANTLADVTGLSFTGAINTSYQIYACIMYTAAATTTGSRWVMAGPAGASANLNSTYTLTATTQTVNSGVGLTTPAAANASSVVASNIAIIEGVVRIGGTSGTVKVQFASEVSSSAIVAKANLSFLEYRAL